MQKENQRDDGQQIRNSTRTSDQSNPSINISDDTDYHSQQYINRDDEFKEEDEFREEDLAIEAAIEESISDVFSDCMSTVKEVSTNNTIRSATRAAQKVAIRTTNLSGGKVDLCCFYYKDRNQDRCKIVFPLPKLTKFSSTRTTMYGNYFCPKHIKYADTKYLDELLIRERNFKEMRRQRESNRRSKVIREYYQLPVNQHQDPVQPLPPPIVDLTSNRTRSIATPIPSRSFTINSPRTDHNMGSETQRNYTLATRTCLEDEINIQRKKLEIERREIEFEKKQVQYQQMLLTQKMNSLQPISEVVRTAEPTVTNPEPTVTNPTTTNYREPTVTNPEPTATNPEPTVTNPATTNCPEPIVTNPEPTATNPEPTVASFREPIVTNSEIQSRTNSQQEAVQPPPNPPVGDDMEVDSVNHIQSQPKAASSTATPLTQNQHYEKIFDMSPNSLYNSSQISDAQSKYLYEISKNNFEEADKIKNQYKLVLTADATDLFNKRRLSNHRNNLKPTNPVDKSASRTKRDEVVQKQRRQIVDDDASSQISKANG